jgi:CheY-like chemotaxis protein
MVLFCGDFALRALAGRALFPMAAPAGGILLIAGWLAAATAARWPRYPEEAGETRPSRVKLDNKRPTCLVSINSHGSAGLRGCPESNMALPGDRAEKGGRILIVEDEPFIALTLEDMLSELGFTVAGTVAQVPEALAFLQAENPIDAALLDVNIGSQKIDPVADLLAERACPFVFTTGYGRSGVPAAHNTRAVVQKPFRLEEIAAALQAEMSAARERPV